MRKLVTYILCFLAFASVGWTSLGISVAYASDVNYVPLAPIDVTGSEYTSTGANSECKAPSCFPRYLRTIYNVGIAIAGLFLVVSIVRGGFTLLYTDSILGHSEGKGIILRALGGILIVYSSYIFMNAISPSLGRELDLSLAFKQADKPPDTTLLTVVSAENEYGKFLDAELARIKDISEKARRIKESITDIEKRIEEGDYKDFAEGQQLIATREGLIKKEVAVRNYQGTDGRLDTARKEINKCLVGLGVCSVAGTQVGWSMSEWLRNFWLGTAGGITVTDTQKASKDTVENNKAANQMLIAARSNVNEQKLKLVSAGLQGEAATLEQKMKFLENATAFKIHCPGSTVPYEEGRGMETDECP